MTSRSVAGGRGLQDRNHGTGISPAFGVKQRSKLTFAPAILPIVSKD